MRRVSATMVGLCTAVAVSGVSLVPGLWAHEPRNDEDADLRAQVQKHVLSPAATAKDARRFFAATLVPDANGRLPDAKRSLDANIALRGAWADVAVALARPAETRDLRAALAKFVGFVEGKLRLDVPGPWERGLYSRHLEHAVPFNQRVFKETPLGWFVRDGVGIEREQADYFLTEAGRRVLITEVLKDRPKCFIATTLAKDRVFVAAFHHCPLSCSVYSIDSQSGRVVWKKTVWAQGELVNYAGLHFHHVWLSMTGDNLYAFGFASEGIYVEGFDAATGECRLRFSTMY